MEMLKRDFDHVRSSVIPEEVQKKLDEIAEEERIALDNLNSEIDDLTLKIKDAVLKKGETVKGRFLIAVFNQGRISWDNKALQGYAEAYPELKQFMKEGAPSVSIREVYTKEKVGD